MITLTNSSSYKNSSNFRDLKELYIHLQYLYSYTIGKFKTLQEELGENMEGLSKLDPTLDRGEDCDDDDLEIVEKVTDCIEVSDDDEDTPPKRAQTAIPSGKPPRKQNLEPKNGTVKFYASEEPDLVVASTSTLEVLTQGILAEDPKLASHVLVKLERIEIIDHMVVPVDADEEMESSENEETTHLKETPIENTAIELEIETAEATIEQEQDLQEAMISKNNTENHDKLKSSEIECLEISDDCIVEPLEISEKLPEALKKSIDIAIDSTVVSRKTIGQEDDSIVINKTEKNEMMKNDQPTDTVGNHNPSIEESTLSEVIQMTDKLGECPPAEILEELLDNLDTIPELETKANGHETIEITEEILAEAEKMDNFVETTKIMDGNVSLDDISEGTL